MPDDVWENCARAMSSPLSRWDFDINQNHITLPDGKTSPYCVISLGCYGLLMVGVGLLNCPTRPQDALLATELCRSNDGIVSAYHDEQ
ncbi:hypothetical protein SADUNF_Sadunf06G0111500 [Salix dunnii]|uniref:Uncharacterized protein n=1 Tax=Salix dunnii TaxID=1413687 RepID=A0A835MXA9_9ROSI|nr:hypothetical protein SADUNF_Sadunf06G0111500 [Salix dunnii]